MSLRATLFFVALAAAMTAVVRGAGPLTIVAPAAPGGGWDQTARAMQRAWASVEPETSVLVENVSGAAGTIGLARFVAAERGNPDALLLTGLVMVSGIATTHSPVNLTETTPIARLTGEYEMIVVPAASPLRTLADLLSAFKEAPASVSWGGGSAGSTDDLLIRLMAEAIGVPPVRVNYIAFPGGGAALAALLGGQVTAGVSGYGELSAQLEAGTLRPLAISAPSRVSGIDVPTLREQGVNLDLANWRGIVAPPGLTDAERDALTARIERLATSEAWRATLIRNNWLDMLLTGPAFRQFLLAEQHRVSSVIQRLQAEVPGRTADPLMTVTPMTVPTLAIALLALLLITNIFASGRQRPAAELRSAAMPQAASGFPRFAREGGSRTSDVAHSAGVVAQPFRAARPLMLVAALSAHAIAFPFLGFVPASAGLYLVAAHLFGSRRWRRDAAIGLLTAIGLYVGFTSGLGLTLPADPLTQWLRG